MIQDLRTSAEWKIYLTMKINFVSTSGPIEKLLMHSKSHNAEIRTAFDTDKIIQELYKSLLQRCQMGLEQSF